jgi:hypothetical protein
MIWDPRDVGVNDVCEQFLKCDFDTFTIRTQVSVSRDGPTVGSSDYSDFGDCIGVITLRNARPVVEHARNRNLFAGYL